MLVYIRESEKDKIICNVDEKDIAEHLRVNYFALPIFARSSANLVMFSESVHMAKKTDYGFIHHIPDKAEERTRRKRR